LVNGILPDRSSGRVFQNRKMKLKLVKYHPLFAYSVGDEFEVLPHDEKTLLDGKYAVPVSAHVEVEKATDQGAESALEEAKEKSKPGKNKNHK
jgi:hypothetical protein